MTGTNKDIYGIHLTPRKVQYRGGGFLCVMGCVIFGAVILHATTLSRTEVLIGAGTSVLLVLGAFKMFISQATIVDVPARVVTRESRFLGRHLIRKRQYSFSDFTAVTIHKVLTENGDQFIVSLKQHSGDVFCVRYLEESTIGDPHGVIRQAGELARKLSEDLQIPEMEQL
jgi:hypothetical protein